MASVWLRLAAAWRRGAGWGIVLLLAGQGCQPSGTGTAPPAPAAAPQAQATAAAPPPAAPAPVRERTMILASQVAPAVIPPGQSLRVTYNWDAAPMGAEYNVFVHVRNAAGDRVFQGDHAPTWPIMTSSWTGKISYTIRLGVPAKLPPGVYHVVAGIWSSAAGRQELDPGPGVTAAGERAYEIATFTVDPAAPPPPLDSAKPQTLDLKGYRLTFAEEFTDLEVSPYGPLVGKKRWIAHKPDNGNFGDAAFVSPEPGFPFTVADGILAITARKDEKGKWRSGLLASSDAAGNGFAQQYGYFEMRARMPEGPGTWPAFWLLSRPVAKEEVAPDLNGIEIDILEQYGHAPQVFHATYHWWYKTKKHRGVGANFMVEDMTKDFHSYGFLWDARCMVWYFDGVELWRQPTPPEMHRPCYVLVNLALGSGWPIAQTPNPSVMRVDYVRVYAQDAATTK